MIVNKPEKIYVAGKYSAPTEGKIVVNVDLATDVAGALFLMGHYPYVPHSIHFIDRRLQELDLVMGYEGCFRWGMEWLAVCDSLFLIDNSPGANRELEFARDKGLKIYTRLIDVPMLTEEHNKLSKTFGHLHCIFTTDHIDKTLL